MSIEAFLPENPVGLSPSWCKGGHGQLCWCRVVWPKDASGDEAIHRLKKAKDFDQIPAWPEPFSALDMLKAAATDYLIDDWSHPVLKRLRGEG